MDAKSYLKKSAEELEEELDKFYQTWQKEIGNTDKNLLPLINHLIDASKGGKRLRGIFVKLGFELAGGESTPDILKPALGYEIFHASILSHDDIIDLSPIRRGKPSIYQALGGDHYGISQAIVLGDIGMFLSVKLVADSKFKAEYLNKAVGLFMDNMIGTGLGEALDIEGSEDVILIARLKTAQYTIIGPLQLGAILAGGNQELLDNLGVFGENLGIAFQIQDDILGIFGSVEELGKSVTSDIEEGKNTLLASFAREASGQYKEVLEKYYGKGQITEEELEKIREVFKDSGALIFSQKKAEEYVKAAKQVIPKITADKDYQKLLEELSDFIISRNN